MKKQDLFKGFRTRKRSMVLLTAVFAILFAAVTFTACGSSSFSIEGKWKNTGSTDYNQIQPGSIIVFNGAECNVLSPRDTYAFYKDGNKYRLDLTALLGGDVSLDVNVIDSDHIELDTPRGIISLTRVE